MGERSFLKEVFPDFGSKYYELAKKFICVFPYDVTQKSETFRSIQ